MCILKDIIGSFRRWWMKRYRHSRISRNSTCWGDWFLNPPRPPAKARYAFHTKRLHASRLRTCSPHSNTGWRCWQQADRFRHGLSPCLNDLTTVEVKGFNPWIAACCVFLVSWCEFREFPNGVQPVILWLWTNSRRWQAHMPPFGTVLVGRRFLDM